VALVFCGKGDVSGQSVNLVDGIEMTIGHLDTITVVSLAGTPPLFPLRSRDRVTVLALLQHQLVQVHLLPLLVVVFAGQGGGSRG